MKFEAVLPAFLQGKKIRRHSWGPAAICQADNNHIHVFNCTPQFWEILMDDWEVVA